MGKNKVEKFVIIGASEFQIPLIEKAKEKGYETHVFAWEDGALGKEIADYFYPISIIEKEKIFEVCFILCPIGIATIASDLAVVTVDYIAEKLHLVGNPVNITMRCTNKFEMRKAFQIAGLPSPKFIRIGKNQDINLLDIEYPVIVKPTDRSGSRGVTKVHDVNALSIALERAIAQSFEKRAIIESFLEGKEYSIEYISQLGKHYFLALTEKITTGNPFFIEKGHRQPANISKTLLNQLKRFIPKAIDALGIENGASHTEIKIDNNGHIGIIEIGARMGGDCIGSDLVPLSTGYDFLGMVIDVAVGKILNIDSHESIKSAEIKFVFNREDLEDIRILREKYPKKIVKEFISAEVDTRKVSDSSLRFGYVITVDDLQPKLDI